MRSKGKLSKAFYIAEIDLPSYRAYTVHVLKMLDSLSFFFSDVELINFFKSKNYKIKKIKKEFCLKSKNFKIRPIFKNKIKNNFFFRIIFGYFSASSVPKKDSLIITRSFYCSFFLILMKKKHFLEIHTSISGLTNFIFLKLGFLKSKYIIRVIFITKSLRNFYKKKFSRCLVLPDASEYRDFFPPKKIKKKVKNILYIGSFYKGRGIDLIFEIAKICKNYNFILIGNRSDLKTKKIHQNNIKIFNHIKYWKVPVKIKKSDMLLMPYNPHFVQINSNNKSTETSRFMSPLKMFEYLASGIPLISSNIKVLREILIDNYNCVLVKNYNPSSWAEKITSLDKRYKLRDTLRKNALNTVKKYSWHERVKKIKNIYEF